MFKSVVVLVFLGTGLILNSDPKCLPILFETQLCARFKTGAVSFGG